MGESAGTIRIDYDANIVRLERKLAKIDQEVKRTSTKMRKNMKGSFDAINRSAQLFGATISAAFAAQVTRGIVKAGNDMEAFERTLAVATGSAEGARRELDFLNKLTEDLGVNFQAAAGAYGKFAAAAKGSNLQGQATRDIFTSVSKAARVLNLDTSNTAGIFRALEQIISKGKVQAEELRGQLGERLAGAFQIAARAAGVTTKELDKLLEQGKVGPEILVGFAKELDKLFGSQVAAASQSAAANIERFNNALFHAKVAAAEGVLPAVSAITKALSVGLRVATDFAKKIGEIMAGGLGFGAQADQLELEARALEKRRDDIIKILRIPKLNDRISGQLRAELKEVNDQLDELKRRQLDVLSGPQVKRAGEELEEIFINAQKRANDYDQTLAQVQKRFATTEEKISDLRAIINRFGDDLTEGQIANIMKAIDDEWSSGLDEIVITTKKRFSKPIKDSFDEIEEASKQAARNIQDAFADFLFDPFEDGVKGMVRSFLDAIRRMLANQAAVQIFKYLGGLFGGKVEEIDVSSLPKKRAMGGPVMGSTPYLVGEQGPELFVPGASGMVIPNHKLAAAGGITVSNVINVNGADPARTAELLGPLLARNRDQVKADLMDLRARGRF